MAVKARGEKSRERNGPSVIDMSISPWASCVEPKTPRSACRLAASTIRSRRVTLNRIHSSTAMRRPPANSAATNCQPKRMSRTRPSSKTRLVDANSKMMALAKLAPRRKSARATATAAYEQDELAAPKPQASMKPFKSGRPSAPATARLETTVWIIAESRKPKASGQKTSQSMKSESCNAWRIALTTGNSTSSGPDARLRP